MMRLVIALLIFFSATRCTKRYEGDVNAPCTDSCTTFNIRVSTGNNSAVPLGNAAVELGWSRPAIPIGNPGRLIATGKTAADGTIRFSFKAAPKEIQAGKFYVAVRTGENFFYQENGYYGIHRHDTVVAAAVHVPRKATLKLVFKNFKPTTSDDYFSAMPSFDTYGSMGIPLGVSRADGQPANSFFSGDQPAFDRMELTGTTAGDQYTHFNMIIKKNGVRTDSRDSLFIEAGKTGTHEITY